MVLILLCVHLETNLVYMQTEIVSFAFTAFIILKESVNFADYRLVAQ